MTYYSACPYLGYPNTYTVGGHCVYWDIFDTHGTKFGSNVYPIWEKYPQWTFYKGNAVALYGSDGYLFVRVTVVDMNGHGDVGFEVIERNDVIIRAGNENDRLRIETEKVNDEVSVSYIFPVVRNETFGSVTTFEMLTSCSKGLEIGFCKEDCVSYLREDDFNAAKTVTQSSGYEYYCNAIITDESDLTRILYGFRDNSTICEYNTISYDSNPVIVEYGQKVTISANSGYTYFGFPYGPDSMLCCFSNLRNL